MKMNNIKKEFANNPTWKEWHNWEEYINSKNAATPKQLEKLLEEKVIEIKHEWHWNPKTNSTKMLVFFRAKE